MQRGSDRRWNGGEGGECVDVHSCTSSEGMPRDGLAWRGEDKHKSQKRRCQPHEDHLFQHCAFTGIRPQLHWSLCFISREYEMLGFIKKIKKESLSLSLSNWSRGSSGPSHESMPCMPAMQSDIHTDFSVPTQLQETRGPPKGCSLEAACLRYGFMMEGICCAIDLHFDSQGSRLKALPLLYSD